ncbi:unnamed protein product [Darwinula stevensoni]|uniref:DM10 domain-containing protein n=1 Tax=Darwinula stevensoni TaxID=69355 RepID=A0A7R9AE29_9CRUS|nr:unnamed protein product [Darwinula stevensoni]CAG0901907.1 unnamed protein product [Darwinula stevensoni]
MDADEACFPVLPFGSGIVGSWEFPKTRFPLCHTLESVRKIGPGDCVTISGPYHTTSVPKWVAYDKQVLCFEGLLEESWERGHRAVKVLYHLEDDTIQVRESLSSPSHIPQGTIFRRQKMPKSSGGHYSLEDMNVGRRLDVHGRRVHLVDCDAFTRRFLSRQGFQVGTVPDDFLRDVVVLNLPKSPEDRETPRLRRRHKSSDRMKRFLDFGESVLKFRAFWEEGPGRLSRFLVHYFLADDTLEVLRLEDDRSRPFLRRAKLPKEPKAPRLPGQDPRDGEPPVLNVVSGPGIRPRSLPDPQPPDGDSEPDPHYTDADLRLGGTLDVWGRQMLLYDMDPFTKEFYRAKYGIGQCPQSTAKFEGIDPLQYCKQR